MIIRVRSSVGIWRVTVEVGASVLNIKRTLAKSYGLDADSQVRHMMSNRRFPLQLLRPQVLSHDPGGDSTLPDDFVGLQHGDLVHLQVPCQIRISLQESQPQGPYTVLTAPVFRVPCAVPNRFRGLLRTPYPDFNLQLRMMTRRQMSLT